MLRIILASFLFAFPAFAGNCDRPQDNDRYLYFKGTGLARSEEDAVNRARADAVRQANEYFGIVVSSKFLSYDTDDTDESSSSSEQSVRSLDNVRLKGFSKLRDCPVLCEKKICRAGVIYKYSREEYEKERLRLDEIENRPKQKKRDIETFGRETKTSRRVTFFFDDSKNGLPAEEFKDIDFEIKGRKYAVAPLSHFHLEPGTYDVVIDHPRYDAVYDDTLTVTSDTKKLVAKKVGWKKAFAHIKVGSNPNGAMVYIDGKKVKKTPIWRPFPIVPGVHKIKLVHPDYADYDTEVNIPKGESRDLNIDLPRKGASFTLRITPADADVYMDGKKLSKQTSRDYPIPPDKIKNKFGNAHIFVVAKDGYEDFSFSEELKFGGTYRKEIRLKSMPANSDGVLNRSDKFIFIPPAADKNSLVPFSVLDASVSYDRKGRELRAIVRINPEKYKEYAFKPLKRETERYPEKMRHSEKSVPMECRPVSGCRPDGDFKGESGLVYVRSGEMNYGFFSDSAPFLPVENRFLKEKNTDDKNLYLIVRTGNDCVQKFKFRMNLSHKTRSGTKIVDPSLSSAPSRKAAKAGGDILAFAVKKCRYLENDPVLLKLGKGE